MKSSILNTLFILTVTYLLIVQADQQDCTCGRLGSGTNPCTCSETVVKAAKLPRPTYYVSPQEINDAAAARNSIVVSAGTSQNGFPNSQSPSSSNSIVYSNGNSNVYTSGSSNAYSKSDSTAYSTGYSNTYSNSDSNTYSGSSSIVYNNGDSITYSNSNSNAYSNSDSNADGSGSSSTYSNSDSNTYSDSSSSSSSGSSVAYSDTISLSDSTSKSNSGCGCSKQTSESLEIDDSTNSNGNIVPSFPPIGDLCYPLPLNPRNGKLIEKTKVTPAYPGKIVCNSCNPSVPYEICINTRTGETTGRTIASSSSGATIGSSSIMYGRLNSGIASGSAAGALNTATNGRNEAITESAFNGIKLASVGNLNSRPLSGYSSGLFSGSRTGSFGNLNSGPFTESASGLFSGFKSGVYRNSNPGSFSRSNSEIYSLPPLVYAGANTASGQKQYSRISISGSSPNCFDDDTDETQVDYSYPEMPADAVSLTLAYKNLRAPNVIYRQGKQFVPEDKLSFGHRTVPNDMKNDKKIPDIPEEKLVTVEKPVVELKLAPPRTVVIGSYDEREEAKLAELEAIERESITREETADQMTESLLTYKDLGYAPVGSTYMKSRNYNGVINGEINDSAEEPCGPLGPPIPDYIPGSVVVQQELTEDNFENSGIGEINESIEIQRMNPSRSGPCSK